jgi:hypothetical protein
LHGEAFISNADQSLTTAKHIASNTNHGERQAHYLDGSCLCNRVSRNEERVALQKWFLFTLLTLEILQTSRWSLYHFSDAIWHGKSAQMFLLA